MDWGYSLLLFLEISRVEILQKVQDLNARSLFPETVLIEAGLKNGSEYWINCTLTWLKEQELEELNGLNLYRIDVLENKKKYSQSVRQKAKALLKLKGAVSCP